jgi:GNAT superfamily N-acetyltransferase
MSDFWTVRPLRPGEEQEACVLVRRVFDVFVAPEYEPEGVQAFHRYADPQRLRERLAEGHDVLLAFVGEALVGVVELRGGRHISLLFVEAMFQGRGIARALMDAAIALGRERAPGIKALSVNASPNSALIYERLGFCATASQEHRDGMVFIPMERELE